MTDKTLEQLETLRDEAEERRREHARKVDSEAREAARAAEAAVRAKHKEETDRLTAERADAYRAWLTRMDAEASHPFEGRKVTRVKPGWRSKGEVEFGVVEVRKSATELGEAASYRIPALGSAFIRLLKKDGSPGLRFERYQGPDNEPPRGWALVEDDAK